MKTPIILPFFLAIPGAFAQSLDFETDGLFSGDIKVIESSFQYEQSYNQWTLLLGGGYTYHEVGYTPAPGTFTLPRNLREDTFEYRLGLEYRLRSDLQFTLSGTLVDGFSDHRSLWISEFYDQQFGGLPSFSAPDPGSLSLSTGLEWDYNPNRGTLAATFGFSRADIVAGNAIDPVTFSDVISTEPELDTFSGSLRWEYAINPAINQQVTFLISRTEGREIRTQLRSDWAFSLSDSLTLRAQVGGSHENPVFEAIYGGLTLVYNLGNSWQFDLGFRYYEDTGEINDANFNTSAPGLDSTEISLGALWRKGDFSVRASVALFDTDFDAITNPENLIFSPLFRDREFVAARLAISKDF